MPTPFENLDSVMRPGFPVEDVTEGFIGNTYLYRGATSLINTNQPAVGDEWEDGRPVRRTHKFELNGASAISEMLVVTGIDFVADGGTVATELEEVIYEIDFRPLVKPLEVHPDFQSSGTYALDATARKHILGWRAELDPDLRSQRKYQQLDSSGEPSGSAVTISGNALHFIKLLEIGVEEWIDYMPIWRKRSLYRGTAAPGTSAIGVKGTPSGSGYPSGYEWVKSRDSAQRIGRQTKWRRDEEWEGALTVYADKVDVFPLA